MRSKKVPNLLFTLANSAKLAEGIEEVFCYKDVTISLQEIMISTKLFPPNLKGFESLNIRTPL